MLSPLEAAPMLGFSRRFARLFAPFLAASLALTGCVTAPERVVRQSSEQPWLYRGSDVPIDKAWTFGELRNGVRYAVRRNGVPPGQVSVRVRIDAGSLMETEAERGFAHYLEHLAFRSSTYVPEGETKRIWERLGATFGSDSNAATTPTQTVYQLDLPGATQTKLDQAVKIIAGMMTGPRITPATVNGERPVLLAEAREQNEAAVRVAEARNELFFAGQPLADREPIGTPASLNAATAEAMAAFHRRWYRPERAVVVIVGDGDPAYFESLIRKHFGKWRSRGPDPAEPDFGAPNAEAPDAAAVVEPSLPALITMATLRPWVPKADTIAYNQGLLRDMVAVRMINRRLETRARAGGSFLQASVDSDDVARSANITSVSIVPLGDDWRQALGDVRAVIAEAMTNPPTQAEIDREAAEFDTILVAGVENARAEAGSKFADDIVNAVDIREAVASAQTALDVFRDMKSMLTPGEMLKATQALFTGVDTRAMLVTPTPVDNAEAMLTAALAEKPDINGLNRAALDPIGFDRVPALGAPATVVKREPVMGLDGAEFVELSNGVRLVIFPNDSEDGKIYVTARFGRGRQALPVDRQTPAWAGPVALVQSGIGDLGQEELDRLTTGRRIGLGLGIDDDAFELSALTRDADLKDQLHLMAAKLAHPGWDPNPVARARATHLAAWATLSASPQAVLSRDMPELLHGGDMRWATPSREEIAALDARTFRAFWEPILASGPIELMIFGDTTADKAIEAARATFGALKPREPSPVVAASVAQPKPTSEPVVRTHTGPADQAAAAIAWPTSGGIADSYEARKLDVLATIFNDRLFERLRQAEGASYSPTVMSHWPTDLEGGGYVLGVSTIAPDRIDTFFNLARQIAAELASEPVTPDELRRAIGPMLQNYARATSGNMFWLRRLSGASWDRSRVGYIYAYPSDLRRITSAELQIAAQRWLDPAKSWSMVVLPEKEAATPAQ